MAKMDSDQQSEIRWFLHDYNMSWAMLSNMAFGRMREIEKMSFYEANHVKRAMKEYVKDMEAG